MDSFIKFISEEHKVKKVGGSSYLYRGFDIYNKDKREWEVYDISPETKKNNNGDAEFRDSFSSLAKAKSFIDSIS